MNLLMPFLSTCDEFCMGERDDIFYNESGTRYLSVNFIAKTGRKKMYKKTGMFKYKTNMRN